MSNIVRCLYDGCHEFSSGSWNGVYCPDCRCKRKQENSKKALLRPEHYDAEVWELQERRKEARLDRDRAKNQWILANKTFAFFDIESTNLDADIGEILCACIKPMGGKIESFSSPRNDNEIIEHIRDGLARFDYVVAFYGSRFDLPFLNTRLLANRMRPITSIRLSDPYYAAKFNLKLHSNRMEVVNEFLHGKTKKTRILGSVWNRAARGDEKALKYLIDHCQADVKILEYVFLELVGLMNLSNTPLRRYA